jgi:WD40 repeat protein
MSRQDNTYLPGFSTTGIVRCKFIPKYFGTLLYVLFAIQQNSIAQNKNATDELYLTQLKTAEAYYRHNQIGEAKNILLSVPKNKRTFEWELLDARMDRSIQTLTAHAKPVVGITISKDGKLIATGSADSSIIIWDAATYQIIRRIAAHKGQVTTLDFSPDSKTLISGSTDKSLRLWNVNDGTEIRNYNAAFKQGIYQCKFSNDGNMLGVASWERSSNGVQGFAIVLDVQTGKMIQRFDTDNHPASAINFSVDNKKLYTGTWGFQIKKHDIASGNLDWNYDMREFDYYTAVQSLDVSPDNKYVVQGGKDNKIRVLNAADGKIIHEIESWEGHKEWVNGIRFSPDGKYFASVSDDGLLKVWETTTAKTLFTFKGHTAGINQLAWHPDGKRIFTTSNDNTIKVWDITQPGELQFKASVVGPWNAPVSFDGTYMAPVNSDKYFALYHIASGQPQIFLDSVTAFSSAFSSDGKYVAAGSRNIFIYDIAKRKKFTTGKGHSGVIYGMDYNSQLNLFVTAGDNTVRLWNMTDTAAVHTVSTGSSVFTAKFSPDGKTVYAGCTNGKVKIISTASWTVVDSLQSGTTIFNMAVSADSKYLITGGNAEVFAWNVKKKKGTALKGHTKWVYGAAFHPTLPLAVTVSYDRTLRFWDVEKGINTLTLFGFAHELYTVSFTNDGKRLVLTETDGLATVINLTKIYLTFCIVDGD